MLMLYHRRGIENGKIEFGFGTVLIFQMKRIFFKDMTGKEIDKTVEKLISLYPRALVTPHIGSYTDEALTNMIEISYENLDEFLRTGDCANKL